MNFNIKHFSSRFRYAFPLFLKLFLALFMALLVFLSVSLVGVRLLGVEIYTMLSSSMEPSYRLGSVIYVKETEISELQIGDVITFRVEDDITVTHRIIGLFPDAHNSSDFCFQTKGDANDLPDGELVEAKRIVGKAIFTIPYLGFFSDFVRTEFGFGICTVVVLLAVFLTILVEWWQACDEAESMETDNTEQESNMEA